MPTRVESAIQKALPELGQKTLRTIQIDTAYTWCGRACAAAELGLHADAIEYAHEAIEHAALSGDNGVLAELREAFALYGVPVG
jgi:hypothetical protein